MDIEAVDKYVKEKNPEGYQERCRDIFQDITLAYAKAMRGEISWRDCCVELDKTSKFYFGEQKEEPKTLLAQFPHVGTDIDYVNASYGINKVLEPGDYEHIIERVLDFDYSEYNDYIADVLREY